MKQIKYISFILILPVVMLVSCKRGFLELSPLGSIGSDATWADGPLSEAFVNNVYNGLGTGGFEEQMLASLSDEAVFTHTGRGINTVNDGGLSPSNTGWQSGTYEWGTMYRWIRGCNVAIENLRTATFTDTALKARLKGEAHFLRAYYYHQLIRYYGAVPLITQVYGLNEDYSIARNTWAECVDFITNECDSAILILSGRVMQKGRANALAAKALKSRILLYAASDLHDATTAKAKSAVLNAYANPEIFAYTSGDRTSRWQLAKAAAKEVMDAGSGYKFNLGAPVSREEGRLNYTSIAMGGGSAAPGVDATAGIEIIMGRWHSPELDQGGSPFMGLYNGPNGYHNWAGNTPIGLLVDDYEYMDVDTAKPFSWSNPVNKADPYANRDPRFYASVMYDGSGWKPRDKVSGNVDPANQIQTGAYDLMQKDNLGVYKKITFNGLDTRASSIEDWNGTRSGYYMRKFLDGNPAIVDNNTRQYVPWPFFRYTEAVMNYIEACIELGEEVEAKLWLNRIRFRSGMPALDAALTGTALRDAYRHERRIEMVYEEQRYHDARRWMIAPTTLGRDLTYISISGKFKPGLELKDVYKHDKSIYDYTYTPIVEVSHENRQWLDKMYLRPLTRNEMNRNSKLVQNPGYD
jgi:starch-binding outer membrane protein, SusD/RagB family